MKIEINIDGRQAMIILIFIAAISTVGLVIAYESGGPPSFIGHSWDEIDCSGCITGSNLAGNSVTSSKIGCDSVFCRDASGNIGIGTSTPQAKLDVAGLITISSCPTGTTKIYDGLCIDNDWRDAATMTNAADACHMAGGRVCTYGELTSACKLGITGTDPVSTNGKWIGNVAGDDRVLCGNGGSCDNFEGICMKSGSKQYKCCYGPAGGGY